MTKRNRYMSIIEDKFYIRKVLDRFGLSPRYIGYYYLIYMVDLLLKGKYKSFYKDLYPLVAGEFNVNACTIERNIRNILKVADLNIPFVNERKLTCRKFIFLITDAVSVGLSDYIMQ